MATAEATGTEPFLPELTTQLEGLRNQQKVATADFCQAMSTILPVFDSLGMFFQFAKQEMGGKVESLLSTKDQQPTLDDVVQKCIQAKTVTVKNSPARNLHRLVSALEFINILMANLAKEPKMTLHNACYDAYQKTMANIHTFVVRTAVKAGMYTLPTRENFLKNIGESGPEAKEHANSFVGVSQAFIKQVLQLYGETAMPRSDSTFVG